MLVPTIEKMLSRKMKLQFWKLSLCSG